MRPSLRLLTAFAVTYVVWGSTYTANAVAVRTLPALSMCGVRFLLAGGALVGWCALQRRRHPERGWSPPGRREWRSAAIIGLLMPAAATGGAAWVVQFVPSGLVALLLATIPIWITVAAAVVDRERIGVTVVVGLLAGLAGTAVLVDPFAGGAPALGPTLVALAGAACWGVGTIVSRRAPLPKQPLLGSGMEMVCAGAVLLVVGALTGEPARLRPQAFGADSVAALLYLIVFGSMIAYSAFGYLTMHAPTRLVGTYAFVNPLVAIGLGALLLGERIDTRVVLAGALVVGGVALLVLRPTRGLPRGPTAPDPGGVTARPRSPGAGPQ